MSQSNERIPPAVRAGIEAGWSFVPVKPGEKRPKGKWKQAQTERASLADVALWLHEGYGLAVVTGAISGCIIVDADSPEAVDEVIGRGIPETARVRTTRGMHFYFRAPDFPAKTGQLWPYVDLRAEVAYSVVPPSVHASGARYEWIGDSYRHLKDLPEPPDWLMALLVERASSRSIDSLTDPIIAPRPAWHGHAPTMGDMPKSLWWRILRGNADGKIPGPNRTHQLASIIVGSVDHFAGGYQLAVDALCAAPDPGESDDPLSRGWFHIQARKDGRDAVIMEVARKYASFARAADLEYLWSERCSRFDRMRSVIASRDWRTTDATALRTALAVIRTAWLAPDEEVSVDTRRLADLTGHGTATTNDALRVLEGHLFQTLRRGKSAERVIELDIPPEDSPALCKAHRIDVLALHLGMHPAFATGSINPITWLHLWENEGRTVADLVEMVGSRRTVLKHLDALESERLGFMEAGEWRRAGGREELDAVASTNGGFDQVDRRQKRSRLDREARRQSNIDSAAPVADGEGTRVKRDPVIPPSQIRSENTPENGAAA